MNRTGECHTLCSRTLPVRIIVPVARSMGAWQLHLLSELSDLPSKTPSGTAVHSFNASEENAGSAWSVYNGSERVAESPAILRGLPKPL